MKHVVVIGAGVIGLASAYKLMARGFRVTVIERDAGVGLGTSYGNGCQLSYSYVKPFSSPGTLYDLPRWLLNPKSPVLFRPQWDPHQWQWIGRFLMACTEKQSEETTAFLLRLAQESKRAVHDLLAETKHNISYQQAGKLVLYADPKTHEAAIRQLEVQRRLGSQQEYLSAQGCLEHIPDHAGNRQRYLGGILTRGEEVADCHAFCQLLLGLLAKHGDAFQIQLNTNVTGFFVKGDEIAAVRTEQEEISADAYVLAAGMDSLALARRLGIRLPLYPLRGYSLTVEVKSNQAGIPLSITDYDEKIVYAPLAQTVRVAGMADLVGRSTRHDRQRISLLRTSTGKFLGHDFAEATAKAKSWTGLRPATPDGRPIIKRSRYTNLFLNVGHGALGFTLAMGSAERLAECMM